MFFKCDLYYSDRCALDVKVCFIELKYRPLDFK